MTDREIFLGNMHSLSDKHIGEIVKYGSQDIYLKEEVEKVEEVKVEELTKAFPNGCDFGKCKITISPNGDICLDDSEIVKMMSDDVRHAQEQHQERSAHRELTKLAMNRMEPGFIMYRDAYGNAVSRRLDPTN